MLPHERSLLEKLKDSPFAIVGVNSDSKKRLKELVADGTTTWRNFTNDQAKGKISEDWGVSGWPTIYILDAKGVIRYKNVRDKGLDNAINTLLAEMEAPKEEKKAEDVKEAE